MLLFFHTKYIKYWLHILLKAIFSLVFIFFKRRVDILKILDFEKGFYADNAGPQKSITRRKIDPVQSRF